MKDDDQGYVCIDVRGDDWPEHDYDYEGIEGAFLIKCRRCGTERDGWPMSATRTTKIVTLTVTATFHGDYLGSDEVATYLEGWIDAGLEDRDDLRRWKTDIGTVVEIDGDPEGFDAPDDTSYGCVDGHGNEWPECDYDEIECRRCGAQPND